MRNEPDGSSNSTRWVGTLAGLVLLFVAGCQEFSGADLPELDDISGRQTEPGDLAGTNWRAVDILDYGGASGAESSISFNESDRLSGKTGCNTFLGPYRLDGNRVTFGPFAMTRMMCEPAVAEQEDAFLRALATATTMDVSGGSMTLLNDAGNVVMSMSLVE